MRVILLANVKNLGKIGEIVTVKNGYGRNFLLPTKLALRASNDNIAHFESKKADYEKTNVERKTAAEKTAAVLNNVILDVVSPAQFNGTLYGSIAIRDIYEKLKEKGHTVPKSQIVLKQPIKEVGKHTVTITLHPEVHCEITVFVGGTQEALLDLMNPKRKKEDDAMEAAEKQVKADIQEAAEESQGESEVSELNA